MQVTEDGMDIRLGYKVRDRITGYEGIAISRHDYVYGCVRFTIQSDRLGSDGKVVDTITVDEPQLEVVNAGITSTFTKREDAAPRNHGDRPHPERPAVPSPGR